MRASTRTTTTGRITAPAIAAVPVIAAASNGAAVDRCVCLTSALARCVAVPDEKATEFEKVQDALDFIEEKLKEKG